MLDVIRPTITSVKVAPQVLEVPPKSYTPAQWISDHVTVAGKPLHLEWRPWWLLPYNLEYIKFPDGNFKRKSLVLAGRQVEKCVSIDSRMLLPDGVVKKASEVVVGDQLVGLSPDGIKTGAGTVTWKSDIKPKSCLLIRTRQGHEMIVATTHPVKVWEGWREAKDLKISDKVGIVRQIFENLEWDSIVEIKDVGIRPCVDFSVSDTNSFSVDGIITHNSSSLGNKAFAEIQIPWTNVLYIAPSATQIHEFSFRRLDTIIETSPALVHQADLRFWSVTRKNFHNRSSITLRSAFLNADRVRGIPADVLFIDEAQDVIMENIPIILETLTHCERPEGPIFRLLGTPKTYDNSLEYYWAVESNQMEWMLKCDGCGKWIEGIQEDNIGPKGLICHHCNHHLNPFGTGQGKERKGAGWYATGSRDAPLVGFRIPQPLLPYSFAYNADLFRRHWESLLYKITSYERPQLFNEVFALSYDSGDKPITREQLKAACSGIPRLDLETHRDSVPPGSVTAGLVFAGIDWGSGHPSKTVFTAGRYVGDVYEIFYLRKFDRGDSDPVILIPELLRLLKLVRAKYVGVDYGFGFGMNSQIRTGFDGQTIIYCHAQQKAKLAFDNESGVIMTNRTAVMTDIFKLIQTGGIRFQITWEQLRDMGFADDFLNIHKEKTKMGRMIYQKTPNRTDDTMHSTTFNFLASQIKFPRPDLA